MRECLAILDELGIKYTFYNPRNSDTRPIKRISVRNYSSQSALLNLLLPYMVGKRDQAVLMAEFIERAARRKGFDAQADRMMYLDRMSQLKQGDRFSS